jgi:hypothetical protein
VERMPDMPPKPQNIIVERWLPYRIPKRRVIHQRSPSAHSFAAPLIPRNLIIEWEAPDVEVMQQYRELGLVDASPDEYMRRFSDEVVRAEELPSFKQVRYDNGCGHASRNNSANNIKIVVEKNKNRNNSNIRAKYDEVKSFVTNNGAKQYRDHTVARSYDIELATPEPQRRYSDFINAAVEEATVQNTHNNSARPPSRQNFDYEASAFRSTNNNNGNNGNNNNVKFGTRYLPNGHVKFIAYDLPDLEGDVEALTLIDLNRYGLQGYRDSVTPPPAAFRNGAHYSLARYNDEERANADRF